MDCDYTGPGGIPLERIAQQQGGTHPAPCARSCEANAYQIEVRRYQAEVEQFRADARRFRIAEKNLFDVQEAAKTIAKQAIAAEAERDALVAKLAELEGQEPVAWAVMNGWAIDGIERSEKDAMAVSAELQKSHDLSGSLAAYRVSKLYARPVPAEPVNARLLDALKLAECVYRKNVVNEGEPSSVLEAMQAAITAAEAQQERLLQDMHDAGREIDRVMAEPAPKAVRLTDEEVDICFDGSDGTRIGAARAIETAVLRKNGIEVAE